MTQTIFGNKTISSLYIHNKEVQSIITSDNVVLYEKENSVTPVVSEPYSISLSASKYILSEYDNDTCVLSATVTDENDDVCSNQSVVFTLDTTVLGTATTDSNGVATLNYNSQGIGDIFITANISDLYSNSILIEDCQYYNDGSSITGLDIKSGVSCSSDGEWITITTSTSGEKFVYPPVCYTGSDNWEVSFKCKTSNYSNQAFGLQMEDCGTTTYSGDDQYTSYSSSSFSNCMGAGNKSYTLLDTDKITFKRFKGYWRLYVNDNTEIFNRSYNWSNSRVPGFYTNRNRIQRLKEIKYKLLNSYVLDINVPLNIAYSTVNVVSGVLKDTKNNLIVGKQVSLKVDGVVVDSQTTDSDGEVTFQYTPLATGNATFQLVYDDVDNDYDCVSEIISRNIIDSSFNLTVDKNIISYKHNESCILTLYYADNNGATVNLYDDDTDILLGTMIYDNNEDCYNYTYSATGNGDITFRAESGDKTSRYTVKDALYYNSGADNSKLSDFDLTNVWSSKNTTNGTYEITTDGEWITIYRTGGSNYGHIPISQLVDLNIPFKVSMFILMTASDGYLGGYSGFYAENNYGILCQCNPFRVCRSDRGASDNWSVLNNGGSLSNADVVGAIFKYVVSFDGTSFTHTVYDADGNQLKNHSRTLDTSLNNEVNSVEYGIHIDYGSGGKKFRIKEVIAEKL